MTEPVNQGIHTYLRLLSYSARYWHVFLFGTLGWLIHSAAEVAFVDLMGFITDTIAKHAGQSAPQVGVTNSGDSFVARASEWLFPGMAESKYWIVVPVFMMFFALVRGIGYLIGSYGLAYVSNHLVHALRTELFNKYLRLPFQFFDQSMSGHLVSTVTFNVQQVTDAGTKAIKVILQQGSMVAGLLAYLLFTNWKLTLFFVAVMPLVAGLVAVVSRRFRVLSKRIQAAMGDVTHVTQEGVNGYQEVRMFGAEAAEQQRMLNASQSNRRQNMKMAITEGVSSPTVMMLVSLAFGGISALMLHPSVLKDMSAGNFFAFLMASGMLIKPIRQLTEVNSIIQRGIAAAESIFGVLDAEEECDKGTLERDQVRGAFEFEHVGFSYSEHGQKVLNDIHFSVEPGQTIALVGSSGAGKTTLVTLIPRFYRYTEGRICLDEIDINDYKLSNLRKHIAIVSQNVTLFNDTVYNNIAYGELAGASREQVEAAARIAHADTFIQGLSDGYSTIVGDDGVMLSGGQRQRIAIARAVLKDAPILILDEATSALDTDSERHIQAALEELMKDRTTFVIAHRLSTVEKASRILVMEQGQIIESGTHQQLLEQGGRYAQLYRTQFDDGEGA